MVMVRSHGAQWALLTGSPGCSGAGSAPWSWPSAGARPVREHVT